jgi:hypothetical protein
LGAAQHNTWFGVVKPVQVAYLRHKLAYGTVPP